MKFTFQRITGSIRNVTVGQIREFTAAKRGTVYVHVSHDINGTRTRRFTRAIFNVVALLCSAV